MAIYQLFEEEKKESFTETFERSEPLNKKKEKSGHFFSTMITRFCFLLLLIADTAWFVYNCLTLLLAAIGLMVTAGKIAFFKKMFNRCALHFRRSLICWLSLFIGLFSPPFGIMVACTYFLMYDKAGMEEVVPATLQAQFKDIFKTDR
jgi:membrane glycosyltransferase